MDGRVRTRRCRLKRHRRGNCQMRIPVRLTNYARRPPIHVRYSLASGPWSSSRAAPSRNAQRRRRTANSVRTNRHATGVTCRQPGCRAISSRRHGAPVGHPRRGRTSGLLRPRRPNPPTRRPGSQCRRRPTATLNSSCGSTTFEKCCGH